MKNLTLNKIKIKYISLLLAVFICENINAQTAEDGLMMIKKQFCLGGMYSHSSFSNYWEGTLKRDNQNMGTLTKNSAELMGIYGVNDKLNLLFSVPYISSKASQGTTHGLKGIQDLSLWVKYSALEKSIGNGTLSVFGLGGLSFATNNYVKDMLPFAIGLGSTNVSARLLLDYELGDFFATASGTFTYRNNISLDRATYYDTQLELTNQVQMPNTSMYQFRTGLRSNLLIAELIATRNVTLGGFDIRRNDNPFPSNRMNATSVGYHLKYTFSKKSGLSIVSDGNFVVDGRNVGQTSTVGGGIFYILDFNGVKKATPATKM